MDVSWCTDVHTNYWYISLIARNPEKCIEITGTCGTVLKVESLEIGGFHRAWHRGTPNIIRPDDF